MPVMTPKEKLKFEGILQAHPNTICKYFNDECNSQYMGYLTSHLSNRPVADNRMFTQIDDEKVAGYVAFDIEIGDVGLYQLLEKLERTSDHLMFCRLFAKATFNGHCPFGCKG